MPFTESTYENAVIQLFESMGYTHIYAPDMGRADFSDPLMGGVLRDALVRINRGLPLEAIGEALSKIRNFEGGSLVEKNRIFTGYLQDGVRRSSVFWTSGSRKTTISRWSINIPTSKTATTAAPISSCLSTVCRSY